MRKAKAEPKPEPKPAPNMSIADQLVHTTVRIETENDGGTGSGTGFFMRFAESGNDSVLAIVTNRHVVEGSKTGVFQFTIGKKDCDEPEIGKFMVHKVTEFEEAWVMHPDPEIDLAAMPIARLLQTMNEQGHQPFLMTVHHDDLPDAKYFGDLNAIEDIVMVGYPNGLWDSHHNLPIIRRGITATLPSVDFEGRKELVIDCACFPGSSGSPVFLYNMGSHVDKKGGVNIGTSRVKLIGVLWGGPQYNAEGEIHAVPVPTAVKPIAVSSLPINLGFCVKADQLCAFESIFQERAAPYRVKAKASASDTV